MLPLNITQPIIYKPVVLLFPKKEIETRPSLPVMIKENNHRHILKYEILHIVIEKELTSLKIFFSVISLYKINGL